MALASGASGLMKVALVACSPEGESSSMNPHSPDEAASIAASRIGPATVAPVTLDGIRYAPLVGTPDGEHAQVGGLLAAYRSDGKLLWSMKIYDNRRQDDLEGDVQDVFFRSMDVQPDGKLVIVNEEGRRFMVDVNERTSTPMPSEAFDDDDGLRP